MHPTLDNLMPKFPVLESYRFDHTGGMAEMELNGPSQQMQLLSLQ